MQPSATLARAQGEARFPGEICKASRVVVRFERFVIYLKITNVEEQRQSNTINRSDTAVFCESAMYRPYCPEPAIVPAFLDHCLAGPRQENTKSYPVISIIRSSRQLNALNVAASTASCANGRRAGGARQFIAIASTSPLIDIRRPHRPQPGLGVFARRARAGRRSWIDYLSPPAALRNGLPSSPMMIACDARRATNPRKIARTRPA